MGSVTAMGGTWPVRAALAALLFAGLAPYSAQAIAAEPWPHQVQAFYRVHFNGIEIGSFAFNATIDAQTYTVTGDAQLTALFGILEWRGETRSAGVVSGDVPKPAGYAFDYNGIGKSGSIRMSFAGDAVTNLSAVPKIPPQPDTVPVRDQHLKGVLDPLSAVMAISRASATNPCGRKLSVFDGRQRFDLALSFRRQEKIVEAKPSGQPDTTFVCGVRYIPLAGHRASEESQGMAINAGIEISLRPVPSVNLLVPYQIRIPTAVGSATLTSERVEITTQQNGQIALVY
jgi:hypothetical protein